MRTAAYDFERVPLNSLKRYLVAAGWRRRTLPSGVEVFANGPEGNSIEIVLPETSVDDDLPERITIAIRTLSAVERLPPDAIISAIRAISYDLVHSRLPDSAIRHDTIKLGTAEEFIKRMVKILAASAHSELHDGPYFLRLNGIAQRYADECRFGHTFRGSFGFTVESPVGPNTLEPVVGEIPTPPLERRAIRRLARGLRTVREAISVDDPTQIIGGYSTGLNANACEELAALVELPQGGGLSFEIVFSPEWGFPPDIGATCAVDFKQAQGVEVIRAAAQALRAVNDGKLRTIVGKVTTLRSRENPSDLFSISGSQDVIVEWVSDEFGSKNVRVSLGPEEYLQAVEAHKAGQAVSVEGELEQARQWRLENPRAFRLV